MNVIGCNADIKLYQAIFIKGVKRMFRLRRGEVKRNVRREISMLKDKLRRVELTPCYGDADLKRKDNDLSMIWTEIYNLQKEVDDFASPFLQAVK